MPRRKVHKDGSKYVVLAGPESAFGPFDSKWDANEFVAHALKWGWIEEGVSVEFRLMRVPRSIAVAGARPAVAAEAKPAPTKRTKVTKVAGGKVSKRA